MQAGVHAKPNVLPCFCKGCCTHTSRTNAIWGLHPKFTLHSIILAPPLGFGGGMGQACPTVSEGGWNLLWGGGLPPSPHTPPSAIRGGRAAALPPHTPPAIYEGLHPSNIPFQGWEELVLQLVKGGVIILECRVSLDSSGR